MNKYRTEFSIVVCVQISNTLENLLTISPKSKGNKKKTYQNASQCNFFLLTSKASEIQSFHSNPFLLRPVPKEISPITIDPFSPKREKHSSKTVGEKGSGNSKTCLDSRNQSTWASLIPCFQADISWADEVYRSFLNASTQDFY
ncbi:hypothetical protein CEXT_294831 [Caerostris extrusa]|uniref:Uncharacterized protein n=1 Tax=Caerostris extrusa TaxID=172846 RepID=A0AAV4PDI7_CAEEX|nr:hypothetical protein CEXT_294831 [Caerostris extrusa]